MRRRRALLYGLLAGVFGSTGCLDRSPQQEREATGADSVEIDDSQDRSGAECADADDPGVEYEQCGNKIIHLDSLPQPVQDEISGTRLTQYPIVASECEYDLNEDPLVSQVMDFDTSYIAFAADDGGVDYRKVVLERDEEEGITSLDFESARPVYKYPIRLVNNTEELLTISIRFESMNGQPKETVDIESKSETELTDFDYRFGGFQVSFEVEQRGVSGEESWSVWENHRGSPTFTFENSGYQFDEPEEVEIEQCDWGFDGTLVSGNSTS